MTATLFLAMFLTGPPLSFLPTLLLQDVVGALDFTSLFAELLRLSPFVAALFTFLFIVWKTLQKKDDAFMSTMREHAAQMLTVQRESIMAQNNSADANRQLAGAIDKICDNQEEMVVKIDDIRDRLPRAKGVRPPLVTDSKVASA